MGTEYDPEASERRLFPNGYFPSKQHYYFIRKYDILGNLLKERKFYYTPENSSLGGGVNPKMTLDKENYIILSSVYQTQFDTIPNCLDDLNDHNKIVFLMRFKQIEDHFEEYPERFTESITLAPNPTQKFVHIVSPEEDFSSYVLKIYNIHGQEVYNWEKTGEYPFSRIDLSSLPQGMYILRFTNGQRHIVKKVIKR